MKQLFLTHSEFNNFKNLVRGQLIYDILTTNAHGVEVTYKDTVENNDLIKAFNY